MALTRKAFNMVGAVRVKEWLVLLLIMAVAASATSGTEEINEAVAEAREDPCPEYEYVYPYWSVCFAPVRHYQAFHLVSGERGGLETSEYRNWVSFTGSRESLGATYYAVPLARDPLLGIPLNVDVILVNSQTHQPLTWTYQPLVRGSILTSDTTSLSRPAFFRFLRARSSPKLVCPRIANARCEAYYLVSNITTSGSGLGGILPYNHGGREPTFIMPGVAGSLGPFTFLLLLPRSDAF